MWLEDADEGTLAQARNLANLPFAFKHLALMPDAHMGYGMPIGGVLATKGVVIPNAVGVDMDIGCGMCAVPTNLKTININTLKKIMDGVRELVPLGFDHHAVAQDKTLMPPTEDIVKNGVVEKQYIAALKQIGTLGGGNHFIEIQKGSDGHIWIMIHSGSRNLGYKVAEHYNKVAKRFNQMWHTSVESKQDLAFLPIETPEAKAYLKEMQYCVDFAFANRKLMMDNMLSVFRKVVGKRFEATDFINIAHNYARWENHYGENVLVHRKGATSAREGETGIVPGSQGTQSYIVKGLGNSESFQSCSHGAGRKLGRKQAIRELDLKAETAMLDKKGVLHSLRTQRDLDEAPGAYKNINTVMKNQSDLVEIAVELKPLAVIKGM